MERSPQATNVGKRVRTLRNLIEDQGPIMAAKLFAEALEIQPKLSGEERLVARKLVTAIQGAISE